MAKVRDAINEYLRHNPYMHLTLSVADIDGIEGGFVVEIAGCMERSCRYLARSLTAVVRLGGTQLVLDFRQVHDFAETSWLLGLDDPITFNRGSLSTVYDLIRFHSGSLAICVPRSIDPDAPLPELFRGMVVHADTDAAIAALHEQYNDPRRTQYHLEVASRFEDLPGLQTVTRRAAGRPEVFCLSLFGTVTNDHIIPLIKCLRVISLSGFSLNLLNLHGVTDETDAAIPMDPNAVALSKARECYSYRLVLTHIEHAESLCLHLIPRGMVGTSMFYICDDTVSLEWIPSTHSVRSFSQEGERSSVSADETVGLRFNELESTQTIIGLPQQHCSHCGLPIHSYSPGCSRCARCGQPLLVGRNGNVGQFSKSHSWPADALDRFFDDRSSV